MKDMKVKVSKEIKSMYNFHRKNSLITNTEDAVDDEDSMDFNKEEIGEDELFKN
jgi:hypothetical protein